LTASTLSNLLLLGDVDIQNALFYLCLNLVGFGVFGQQKRLLELLIGELATEIASVLLAFLVIGLLLHFDVQIIVRIHMDLEVFFV